MVWIVVAILCCLLVAALVAVYWPYWALWFTRDELKRAKRLGKILRARRVRETLRTAHERAEHDQEVADQRIAQAVSRILPTITEEEWSAGTWAEPSGLLLKRQPVVPADNTGRNVVYISREGWVYTTNHPYGQIRLGVSIYGYRSQYIAGLLEEYASARESVR